MIAINYYDNISDNNWLLVLRLTDKYKNLNIFLFYNIFHTIVKYYYLTVEASMSFFTNLFVFLKAEYLYIIDTKAVIVE